MEKINHLISIALALAAIFLVGLLFLGECARQTREEELHQARLLFLKSRGGDDDGEDWKKLRDNG